MNNQKIEDSFKVYLKECPEVETILTDAILISNKLPKCKSLHVPKKIVKELNLKDHQWIYLIINNLIHPVTYVKWNVSIPLKLRKLVEHNENIKILINPIITNKIVFLSSFRPIWIENEISYYYMYIHPLIKNNVKLSISIGKKYIYGTSIRGRIRFYKKIFNKLNLEPFRIYQFTMDIGNKESNNKHLFENNLNLNLKDNIKDNKIILPKLLPDFKIKDLGKQIEVFYETRCRDSKKIKLNKEIKLSEDLLRLFGLYQAEGTKTRTNYLCFTNNDTNQIRYFKEVFSKIFGINNKEWSLEVGTSKNKEEIRHYWQNLLGINRLSVSSNSYRNSEYGAANLRICNNTTREIVQRILKLLKYYIITDKEKCGYFLSGVLAGDGYVCTEENRVKRVELYFDPNKIEEEFLFYLNCLKTLDVKNHYTKVYYQKNSEFLEEKAREILKKIGNTSFNITVSPKNKIQGVGGAIFIHRKDDIQKLARFKLFYPNIQHYNKFYKYWSN